MCRRRQPLLENSFRSYFSIDILLIDGVLA